MKLYYFSGSCALADHIVLEWIGAPYETVRMSPVDVKTPQYLALNPEGVVPLLVDGDFTLTQNVAILSYLADRYPEARLFGGGTPRGRELARALADAAAANVRRYFCLLAKRLEGRRWLVDERSIADPYPFVMLRWAIRLDIGLDGFTNLSEFAERMDADSAVRAAITAEEDETTHLNFRARA